MRGLATILPFGGLDLEDQQNGLIVISFVGLDLKNLMSRNSKFEIFLPLFLFTSSLACVCKILAPLLKSHHSGNE